MRIRQHVNPLRSDYLRIPVAALDLPDGVPVEVELGAAEAWFLMDRAEEAPGGCYVGLEIRRELVEPANAEAARRGLGGAVRSVFANVSVDLPRLLPPGRVRRFFLNFPDPWWKSKQQKRRVVTPGLAAELGRLLEPGGEVYVASDVFEIALDAMAVFEAEAPRLFESLAGPWSFLRKSPFRARSRRERQCEAEGLRIWRLGFRRI